MKIRLFISLLFFFVAATWPLGCSPQAPRPAKKMAPAEDEEEPSEEEKLDLAQQIMTPKNFEMDLSRDPFEPLEGMPAAGPAQEISTVSVSALKIVGILCKDEGSIALLESADGTQMLKVGEKIGQCVISKIEPKKVTIEENGQEFILELGEEE